MFPLLPKEELYLGQFIRLFAGNLIKGTPGLQIPSGKNVFTSEQCEAIKKQLIYFRLVVLLFLLREVERFGRKSMTPHDISSIFIPAVLLAYKDNGLSEEAAKKQIIVVSDRMGEFISCIEHTEPKELDAKGVFFFLCVCFQNSAFTFKADQSKQFQLFSISDQTFKSDRKAFEQIVKKVAFLD